MPRSVIRSDMARNNFYVLSISLAVLLSASSCATGSPAISPGERTQLIEQLQEARQTDLINAKDVELGPDAAGDYMIQADKAEAAINDLEKSNNVPSSEIADALFVPPKHQAPEMRASLIQQLQHAKA